MAHESTPPQYPTGFRFNRPRSWALWPSSAAQQEISKVVADLNSNITFELLSNVQATAIDPTLIKTPEGKDAVFAHAPTMLFEDLNAQKQSLSFGVGLRPGAYTDGGRTTGVFFKIWLETVGGGRTLIWSRLLNPVEQPQDRGTQWVNLSLDPPKGSRLILETAPNGPPNWDWSYWADVRIK
jgi:hypothetical protein